MVFFSSISNLKKDGNANAFHFKKPFNQPMNKNSTNNLNAKKASTPGTKSSLAGKTTPQTQKLQVSQSSASLKRRKAEEEKERKKKPEENDIDLKAQLKT